MRHMITVRYKVLYRKKNEAQGKNNQAALGMRRPGCGGARRVEAVCRGVSNRGWSGVSCSNHRFDAECERVPDAQCQSRS